MLRAWRETGQTLSVGHCYRRAAGHRTMKKLIEDGTLGRPLWAEAAFTNPAGQGFTKDRWRYFKAECPGGPLMQMGIHHCDTLRYLLGKPTRVTGHHKHLATPAEIDDVSMSVYEHESGAISNVTTCFTSPDIFSMKLHGTEAALHLEMIRSNITLAERTNAETTLRIEKKGEKRWTEVPLPEMTNMVRDELDEFAECVREGKAPETGPAEGVYALALVEGSVRSAEEGGRSIWRRFSMASISRARAPADFFAGGPATALPAAMLLAPAVLAVMLFAAFLIAPPPAGAKEPEGGVFPGEKDRLPAKEEKDALGLLFGEAELFLASEERPPENFRVFWALENPKRFSARKEAEGAPRPPMDFLGWGMIAWRGKRSTSRRSAPRGGSGWAPPPRRIEWRGR